MMSLIKRPSTQGNSSNSNREGKTGEKLAPTKSHFLRGSGDRIMLGSSWRGRRSSRWGARWRMPQPMLMASVLLIHKRQMILPRRMRQTQTKFRIWITRERTSRILWRWGSKNKSWWPLLWRIFPGISPSQRVYCRTCMKRTLSTPLSRMKFTQP